MKSNYICMHIAKHHCQAIHDTGFEKTNDPKYYVVIDMHTVKLPRRGQFGSSIKSSHFIPC